MHDVIGEVKEQLKQAFPTNWEAERKSHRLLMREAESEIRNLKEQLAQAQAALNLKPGEWAL